MNFRDAQGKSEIFPKRLLDFLNCRGWGNHKKLLKIEEYAIKIPFFFDLFSIADNIFKYPKLNSN